MNLLDKKLYDRMKSIVPEDNILCNAIVEQSQEGSIYVDDMEQPQSYFIRNSSGVYYVGGNLNNVPFIAWLVEYLKNPKNHKVYYDLYASSKEWLECLEIELQGSVVRLGRVNYKYQDKSNPAKNNRPALPQGFYLTALDEKLYEKYVDEEDDSYSDLFSSAQDFITRSFGFCILHENEFVSICNAYHISQHLAEVDVWTNSKYRNQGYATIVVNAFVNYCKENHLLALWNADKGNAASIHLAQKCGFKFSCEEEELWWHKDKRQIEQYLKRYGYTK